MAPVIFPCGGDLRYQGIERLAYYWAVELRKRGHQVAVAAAEGSTFPPDIAHISVPRGDFEQGEFVAFGVYRSDIREFDLILDFTHSHWAMREMRLPALAWCWHTPAIMQPPLPPYNLCALTGWQARQLRIHQGLNARVLDCHCGPPATENPAPEGHYVFIGRAHPSKGMLEATDICLELGVSLRIIGGLGPGDDPSYLERVRSRCQGGVEYWGEATDEVRNECVSQATALIYPINYEGQMGEAHSHKSVDSLLLGTPVVAYDQGALAEVVEQGVDGFLARDVEEFKRMMVAAAGLDRNLIRERATSRWSIENVVDGALPLLHEVAGGLSW